MIKCKICKSEFDEKEYSGMCPECGEKYYTITLTDYQKLVEYIQEGYVRFEAKGRNYLI